MKTKNTPDYSTQATEWFIRLRSDIRPEQERQEHAAWLAENPQHLAAWREVEALWSITGEYANRSELVAMRDSALQSFESGPAPPQPETAVPELRRAAKQHRDHRSSKWSGLSFRWWLSAAVAAVVTVVVLNSAMMENLLRPTEIYETAIGESRGITLADGTVVTLDTQSRIVAELGNDDRRVVLQKGQARFQVAEDTMRPFTVAANEGEITALGTAFVVRKINSRVDVTLLEGRVAVTRRTAAPDTSLEANSNQVATLNRIELEPGQKTSYSNQGVLPASKANILQATAWQKGRLVFEDNPLSEVLKDLNRYSRKKILLGDDNMQDIRITGVFKTGDHGKAVTALKAYFPMRVIADGKGNYVLLQRRETE